MLVKVVNNSTNPLPKYESKSSAGMDLRACLDTIMVLRPLDRAMVKTGLYIQMPLGVEAQVRPRSGLAIKSGVTVLNSPGTIDSDYRGEICIILINLSNEDFEIKNGDRIAQLVFAKHESVDLEVIDSLEKSARGESGFGSTGIK